jgi:hypothetical protein
MYQNKITYFITCYLFIFIFLKMIKISNNRNECNKTSLLIASIVGLIITTNSDNNVENLCYGVDTDFYV